MNRSFSQTDQVYTGGSSFLLKAAKTFLVEGNQYLSEKPNLGDS